MESDLNAVSAKALVGSFVYLTTRHTWNKAARKKGKLLVPETELYELLTVRLTTFVPSDRKPLLSAQRHCFCRWTGHITAILAGVPSSRDTSASTSYRSGRVRTTSALRYTPHVPLNGKG